MKRRQFLGVVVAVTMIISQMSGAVETALAEAAKTECLGGIPVRINADGSETIVLGTTPNGIASQAAGPEEDAEAGAAKTSVFA